MELPENINEFVLSSKEAKQKPKYVLFGVPEDTGSDGLAIVEGSAGGPDAMRKASQMYCAFHRTENGALQTFITNSYKPIDKNTLGFFDAGDRQKSEVSGVIASSLKNNTFPITLGGDHSVTYEVLKGVNEAHKKFAVVYFDAHPDFRSSDKANRKSYATVMYDASKLSNIKIKNSIQIGISDLENEEFENMRVAGIKSLTPLDIERIGMYQTVKSIKRAVGNLPFYISIDLDSLDQSFAPAVSTPSPCGLSSRELLFILTELAKGNVIGLDIMEHTPSKDGDPLTSTVGARLIIEFIVRHNTK